MEKGWSRDGFLFPAVFLGEVGLFKRDVFVDIIS